MARFDPFGDFETAGYLQNAEGFKTASAVKRFEHREYQKALPAAMAALLVFWHNQMIPAVIPAFIAGIHPSARASASIALDPGDTHRDDKGCHLNGSEH